MFVLFGFLVFPLDLGRLPLFLLFFTSLADASKCLWAFYGRWHKKQKTKKYKKTKAKGKIESKILIFKFSVAELINQKQLELSYVLINSFCCHKCK